MFTSGNLYDTDFRSKMQSPGEARQGNRKKGFLLPVAIDGKALRSSFDHAPEKSAIHMTGAL